jgi:subtilisin-like proprotein convertase family protein
MTTARHPVLAIVTGVLAAALGWLASPGVPHAGATVPPSCSSPVMDEATFLNTTVVPIPDQGGPLAVSTINASGLGGSLVGVSVLTNVTHTFSGDIFMTLTSPAGTVVTLTTGNGGDNDNVFAGTLWNDDANPGGAVPYVNNNGMATDHVYVDLVTASPLTPEEPLGAFDGENPNGTWTLTIDDNAGGDLGTLNSWGLDLQTFSTLPETALFTGATGALALPIPDHPAPIVISTIAVAGARSYLTRLVTVTDITHTFPADIDMTLTSPAGTIVTLSTDNGATNDDVFAGTRWDDQANPGGALPYLSLKNDGMVTDHAYVNGVLAGRLTPEEPLSAFDGENPNGTWTLTIEDDGAGDVGTLRSWKLEGRAACPEAKLTIENKSVKEGNAGTRALELNVRLSKAAQEVVRVSYATANGSAKAGKDYTKSSGVVLFQPGELVHTVTIRVIGDRRAERNETFFVKLSKPTGATIAKASGRVTIRDDD